jgi:small subunit ribosomal protein S21
VINESGHVDVTRLHRSRKQISMSTPAANVTAATLKIAMKLLRIWLPAGSVAFASSSQETQLQVLVRDNNVEQALRVLKKKMQREGVFREMKQRRSYEKPSERKTREKSEAIRRARKLARKQAIREGLLPAPPKKKPFERKPPLPEVKARVPTT